MQDSQLARIPIGWLVHARLATQDAESMRTGTAINSALNVISERDFLYPDADEVFYPTLLAYIHRKDYEALFNFIEIDLKTPPEALKDPRFDYLTEREKQFSVRAFVYHLDNVQPRPLVPDHVEIWMKPYER